MAQRLTERRDTRDDFPTPVFATRAFVSRVLMPRYPNLKDQSVWEPSCNRGYMSRPLAEYFGQVFSSDLYDYGWYGQNANYDFLGDLPNPFDGVDWVITNPPFSMAEAFVQKALSVAKVGVAVIVRSVFLEGSGRYTRLFKSNPPQIIAQCVERVPMVKGRFDPKASTATAYSWLVWEKHGRRDPQFVWIPPCRKAMERDGDADLFGCPPPEMVAEKTEEAADVAA
jgi:hypothetical protein